MRRRAFPALNQITPANVAKLALSFTFSTATTHGYEAPPLVVNGTMYLITPFPNYLYALDLTKPGAPTKWVFKPKPLAASQGVACCDVVNRGAVYDAGKIFFNTLDGQTIAVDANSGQQVWRTQLGDIQKGETITMAPLVAERQSAGRQFGRRDGRSRLDRGARRRQRQARLERVQHRPRQGRADRPALQALLRDGPGQGPRRQDLAARRVEDRRRHRLGLAQLRSRNASSSITASAIPGPWNPDQRPGDNKWTTGVFARDVEHRRGGLVLPDDARTTCSTTTTSTRSSSPTFRGTDSGGRCCSARPATASSTSWTAAPGRCCRRRRTAMSTATRASTSRPGMIIPNHGQGPQGRRASSATSARPRRASRTGTRRRSARSPASSTSRTTTSAWTSARCRRTTSPARPMSART